MDDIRKYIKELLFEMPIKKIEKIGNFSKGGAFSKIDRAILNSEKGIQKILKKWEKTPYNFNIYLLHHPVFNKQEYREVGEISDLYGRFDGTLLDFIQQTTKTKIDANQEGITIIFNGNSGDEKVMFTPWIMAHRFGHAINSRGSGLQLESWKLFCDEINFSIKTLVRDLYNINIAIGRYAGRFGESTIEPDKPELLKYIFQHLGTFASARKGKIRNFYEAYYELFAQYLLTGSVKFQIPIEPLITKYLQYGRKETKNVDKIAREMWERDLEMLEDNINSRAEEVLRDCLGKVFLM